jgi:outer membrane protein
MIRFNSLSAVSIAILVASIGLATSPATAQSMSSSSSSATSSSVVNPDAGRKIQNPAAPTAASTLPSGGLPQNDDTAANVFDLPTAIVLGLKASGDLLVAETDLQKDKALASEASDAGNLKINADGTVTHIDSKITVPFALPNLPPSAIVVEPENTQSFDAAASLPIDISGYIKAQTQAAELQVLADRFNVDRVHNALVLNTQTSYFNVLRAQHQVQVAQSAVADAQTQYRTADTQYTGGVGQKIDVYRASTQVAQAQQTLLQAQNAFALAQDNFNDVVGRKLNAPVIAKDVPGVTAGTTVTASGQPPVVGAPDASVTQFYAPSVTELNQIDLDNDIAQASDARPELRADLVDIQAASKQITLARAEDGPSLTLSATGDYYPVTDFQTPRHSLGVYSATLHIPVFDGWLTRDRVRAAKDDQTNTKTTYSSDQTTVELQVRQAYLNLYTAANQITAANTALQQAIAARELAQVRYASGVGLYLEVTDAESALTQAENSQVNSVYDYLIARAQYQNAVGAPDLNPTL